MSFTRRAALGLIICTTFAAAGCGIITPKKKGTLSCSCGGTGCSCSHCSGEGEACSCTATDAYPNNRVGEPGD
jgi:hypothetical protein